jgi:plastocyanin
MRGAGLTLAGAIFLLAWPGAAAIAADHTVGTQGDDTYPVFTPATVDVNVGDTVTWKNTDMGNHNVVADNGSFKGGGDPVTHDPAPTGWTFTHRFNTPGTFRYYCSQHGAAGGVGMAGKIIVRNPNDHTPPKISSLKAKPGTLCTKKTANCKHPGTHVDFTLSEAATVKGAVKPDGSKKTFAQAFKTSGRKGSNSFKWGAKGLKPGKYDLRLQATDASGNKSSFSTVKFTVRKS